MQTFNDLGADDVSAIMAKLPDAANPQSGIMFDGVALSVPDELADRVAVIVADLAGAHRQLLINHAGAVRFRKETGGVVINGARIDTSRESQAMITGAVVKATIDPAFSTRWKCADGSFAALDAAGVIALGNAVGAHVAACFAAEESIVAAVVAGTIASAAAIDAAAWPAA